MTASRISVSAASNAGESVAYVSLTPSSNTLAWSDGAIKTRSRKSSPPSAAGSTNVDASRPISRSISA